MKRAARAKGDFRPRVLMLISEPVGSTVHIEYSDSLNPPDWKPLTTLTNLPV